MIKPKALILHTRHKDWQRHWQRFKDQFSSYGWLVEEAGYNDLSFVEAQGRIALKVRDGWLKEFNLILVKNVGKWGEQLNLLTKEAEKEKIPLFDRCWQDGNLLQDRKSLEFVELNRAGVVCPRTVWGYGDRLEKLIQGRFDFPLIVKETDGCKGRGTFFCQDLAVFEFILREKRKKSLLIQELVPNDGDIRVIVVGGRVLGAMQRGPKVYKKMLDKSSGKARQIKLSSGLEEIGIKAAMALGIDIAGVDLVFDKEKDRYVVLEVNRSPQFRVFERVTGVDVIEEIVRFILKVAV